MPDSQVPANANDFIKQQLDNRLMEIENDFQADALSFNGPLFDGVDDIVRSAIEDLHGSQNSWGNSLVVVLTTEGGKIEPVRRIVDTLRAHYGAVHFVIPNHAYSAGTVFVMSGDSIHMDYYSRLGPIDPQIRNNEGRMVPALGYLERYKSLVDKAQKGNITMAEVQLLIRGFDQAALYQYEQARDLSITLLKQWLVNYKFKNWTVTESRGKRVTQQMRTRRASTIGNQLNDTNKWHVHGHGISKDVLEKDLKLKIDDFGKNTERSKRIRDYHNLLDDYMGKLNTTGVVHARKDYRPFSV